MRYEHINFGRIYVGLKKQLHIETAYHPRVIFIYWKLL